MPLQSHPAEPVHSAPCASLAMRSCFTSHCLAAASTGTGNVVGGEIGRPVSALVVPCRIISAMKRDRGPGQRAVGRLARTSRLVWTPLRPASRPFPGRDLAEIRLHADRRSSNPMDPHLCCEPVLRDRRRGRKRSPGWRRGCCKRIPKSAGGDDSDGLQPPLAVRSSSPHLSCSAGMKLRPRT